MPNGNLGIFHIEDWRINSALDHTSGITEEGEVMVALIAESQRKGRRIHRTTCTTCSLRIICRRRRYISHKYRLKTTYINTHFECCGATQDIQFLALKLLLILISSFFIQLCGMLHDPQGADLHLPIKLIIVVICQSNTGIKSFQFTIAAVCRTNIFYIMGCNTMALFTSVQLTGTADQDLFGLNAIGAVLTDQ